jgi:hypothetical protein
MPKDPEAYLARSDFAFVEAARRRGGEKAAQRMINAIVARASRTMVHDERKRKALMSDDVDHSWPPSFITRKIPLPPNRIEAEK